MSYDIIQKIRLEQGRVFITRASNNVWPRYYHESESTYFTEILHKEGLKAFEKRMLWSFFSRSFQAGLTNRYEKAVAYAIVNEGLDLYHEWDKSSDETYKDQLLEKLHNYLYYKPKPHKCHLEHNGSPLTIKRGNRLIHSRTDYQVFNNVMDAKVCIHRSSFPVNWFAIKNEN